MSVVRVAITQVRWTGDEESMVAKHGYPPQCGRSGRQPHLLSGALSRTVLRGRAGLEVLRVRAEGPRAPHRTVRGARPGAPHGRGPARVRRGKHRRAVQHCGRDRRGRQLPGEVPQEPHPSRRSLLGEVLLPPGQLGVARVRHRGRQDRCDYLLRPDFPEGWRMLGLAGAEIVFNPNASKPGLSNRLWELEQPCAAGANGYFVAVPNRVGLEEDEFGDEAVDSRHLVHRRPHGQLRR